jgi:hypothetical protein
MARRAGCALVPLFNTALDFIFYDVPTLGAGLAEKDAPLL